MSFPSASDQPGGWEDPAASAGVSLAFGASRQPNPDRATLVIATVSSGATLATETVQLQVDGQTLAAFEIVNANSAAVTVEGCVAAVVPPGGSYELVHAAGSLASITNIVEYTL